MLGAVNILEGKAAAQEAENRLENKTHDVERKMQVQHLGQNNPIQQYKLLALSSRHFCRKMPGNAGEQDEQVSSQW